MAGSAAVTLGTNAWTVNQDFTFGGTTAGNNLTIPGVVTLSGSRTVTVTSPAVTDTISGQITGGTGFTKAGAGTLVVSSTTNNYGGGTTISGGVLQLGAANVIPDGTFGGLTVAAGAAFNMNAFSETVGSLSGDTTATGGMITNSSTTAGVTLTIGNANTSTTFAGIITAAGTAGLNLAPVKNGAGNQTLSGANTYLGATTINAGTLTLFNGSTSAATATLSNSAITVASTAGATGTLAVNMAGASTTTVNIGSASVTSIGASITLNQGVGGAGTTSRWSTTRSAR